MKTNSKKIFFGDCQFLFGAHNFSQIQSYPWVNPRLKEVAFIGASNVGKSSLINALLGRKIAIVSSTPGRTRQLNFFLINNNFTLVDMPGYGYAKAEKKDINHWQRLSIEYLYNRANLKRVFLLIDPIKGIKENDIEIANIFNVVGVSFQIILTKSDKIKPEQLEIAKNDIKKMSNRWPALHPQILISSSSRGFGIKEIQDSIIEIL